MSVSCPPPQLFIQAFKIVNEDKDCIIPAQHYKFSIDKGYKLWFFCEMAPGIVGIRTIRSIPWYFTKDKLKEILQSFSRLIKNKKISNNNNKQNNNNNNNDYGYNDKNDAIFYSWNDTLPNKIPPKSQVIVVTNTTTNNNPNKQQQQESKKK